MEMITVMDLRPGDRFMWHTGETFTFTDIDIAGPEVDGRVAVIVAEQDAPLGASITHLVVLVGRP